MRGAQMAKVTFLYHLEEIVLWHTLLSCRSPNTYCVELTHLCLNRQRQLRVPMMGSCGWSTGYVEGFQADLFELFVDGWLDGLKAPQGS